MHKISVKTSQRQEFVDITQIVQALVPEAYNGACLVYVPHTTAGITINEHADPNVARDIIKHLKKLVPANDGFSHAEGNSDAHIIAAILGSSVTVIIENGKLVLGTWQGIFFADFDGPRNRKAFVKFISSKAL
ncbi:MAG: secondary thiamine-phosphate synthase enzyme YjbQ [Candidatus Zixiibacteriota bacterium]